MNKFNHEQTKEELFRSVFLMMFFVLSVTMQAQSTTKQHLLNFNLQNRTLEYVIKYIEKNSEYVFMYSDLKSELNTKVTLNVNDKTINNVLDLLMPQINGTYEIVKNQIVLKKKTVVKQNYHNTAKPKKTIHGLVIDAVTSEPIIGAAVMIKGSTTGTATSLEGDFTLQCSEGDTLSVSYIGYASKEIPVKGVSIYSITLGEDTEQLEEVVVTAYGISQKKENLVGAIQQVRPTELKVPTSSLSSSFAGRMAGVIAVNRSGEPGADGANFWIRGKSTFSGATGALIIIDGMQATTEDLNALDPEVIESFSILKDATATAMYGTLGANGVMVVTTKKGEEFTKPVINFRIEGAMSSLSDVPQMVDGVRFMELYNEAASRPDAPGIPYPDSKIENTRAGVNSLLYPNLNWYEELFKKYSFGQKLNLNIRGGSSKVNYFMSLGIKHNEGNLKSLSKDYFSYNNNINVKRYDFVNNLSLKLTKTTKISLGLNVGINDYSGPAKTPQSLFAMVMDANPVDFPIKYPAEKGDTYIKWGGKNGGHTPYPNPVAEMVTGMKSTLSSTVTANLKIEQNLDFITKGLNFTGAFYFRNYTNSGTVRTAGYNRFEIDTLDDATGDYSLRIVGTEQNTALSTSAQGNTGNRNMYLQAVLNYNRKFNEKHNVNGMLLYNQQQYDTNMPYDLYTSLPQRKQGIAGRLSYNYDNRYLIEANFGYNGSENFAKGHRFGFFPSIGVAYNISQEKYWDRIRSVISRLKLRGSWGLVGNDNTGAGRFAYMENISLNGSQYSYETGIGGNYSGVLKGPKWNRYFNPNLTWEVGEKYNLGLDLQLFNSLNINVEFFKETRKNIFQQRGAIPDILGVGGTKIYGNLGKMQNEGVDLSLDYNKQINNDWFVSFKGTFTYAHNIILEKDEPNFLMFPNLSQVGYPLGTPLLHVAKGLFPDQETIDSSPEQRLGADPLPGDLWYEDIPDINNYKNGVITSDDKIRMGFPSDPEIVYGFGPSIKYKNFDFSLFFQGTARTSLVMSDFFPFDDLKIRGVLDFVSENCWTIDNPDVNAEFPRLKLINNRNNDVESSYWLRNAAFLKLKNAEIGYTFKKMRFYINGFNLLTFSPFKYWDPEMGGGNGLKYPIQRTINVGFQMTIN